MVARLRISPTDGIKMSPPGIDVNAIARKLLDPRFSNLQLHARGSGTMVEYERRTESWSWRAYHTFDALPSRPIAFVSMTYHTDNYVDYPNTFVPVIVIQGPSFNISYPNWFKVTENSIEILGNTYSPAQGGQAPTYKFMVMKNLRES